MFNKKSIFPSETLPFPSNRALMQVILAAFFILAATPLLASAIDPSQLTKPLGSVTEVDWGNMAMVLFGGLAMFLFGMEQMTDALKAVAGNRMKTILATLTTNRFTGVLSGALLTAIIQSSSVTTVLTVGFVSAGVISLTQSIGIIFGAEIGTTITAQVIAFKVTKYSMVMISAGFLMFFVGRGDTIRQTGKILLGLGLVFYGMSVMSQAMEPLREYKPFLDMMINVKNPFVAILITAGFTALIQSSSATTGIIIVMASQGFIPLSTGIALAFGANIGTCITALLAAIGKPREAVRTAIVHITFNTSGVLIWVGMIGYLTEFVTYISPVAEGLSGAAKLAEETPRQIANAHTLFNVANTLLFLPFVSYFARGVEWLVPDRIDKPAKGGLRASDILEKAAIADDRKPIHLSSGILKTPPMALNLIRVKMVRRMGRPIQTMFQGSLEAVFTGSEEDLRQVEQMDTLVDVSYAKLVPYLGIVGRHAVTSAQSKETADLLMAANDLEDLGDVIEKHVVHIGRERLRQGLTFDDKTSKLARQFHKEVSDVIEDCLTSIMHQDRDAVNRVTRKLPTIQRLSTELTQLEMARLVSNEPNAVAQHALNMELFDKYRWIYFRARRIAMSALGMREGDALES